MKDITSSVPKTISQGENLITNPYDITNIFNNYFSSADDAVDSEEIANAISTLNMNKCSGPNSIRYKILNQLKKHISKQLADLFNLSHQVPFHHYLK